MQFIKKYWWLLLVFIGSFLCLNFVAYFHNYDDPINNYGFAYAIARGEVPYLDFNLISTPLYAFVTSLGLFIYNNYLTFLLEQSFLIAVCCLVLYKLFDKKITIILLITILTLYGNIIPTYNFFCFFIMILIIFMENKHNDKDYLIGFLIALGLLSKQTVGVFFVIPSIIFYHKNLAKLKKRFIGFIIPCSIFLIYLLVNKCLYQFIDLCFLGLFDFFNNNGIGNKLAGIKYLLFSIVGLFVMIFMLFRHPKDINLYYLISGFFFAFPLFDDIHFAMFLNCIVIAFLPYINSKNKSVPVLCTLIFILFSLLLYFTYPIELVFTTKLNHFEYLIHDKKEYKKFLEYNDFLDKYNNKKLIIIGRYSMKYTLYSDKKVDYFSSHYTGNFGFNGSEKMIKKIKKMHDCYFAVSIKNLNDKNVRLQFDKKIARYIMKNFEEIANFKKEYKIYYKK